ncbi:MAG: class I SAM-dependent methyltransferase [Candidatus Hadarchaeales archaeon]
MERKLEVMRRYDETAHIYNRRYSAIQRKKYSAIKKFMPGRCGVALDLGCGSGLFFEELSKRAEILVGQDISEGMLKIAGKIKHRLLVRGDAEHLPFSDDVFDLVVSVTLMQNVADPEMTMKEIARVLKRGGRAVVTSLRKKYGYKYLRELAERSGMRVLKAEEIQGTEDDMCVAVK